MFTIKKKHFLKKVCVLYCLLFDRRIFFCINRNIKYRFWREACHLTTTVPMRTQEEEVDCTPDTAWFFWPSWRTWPGGIGFSSDSWTIKSFAQHNASGYWLTLPTDWLAGIPGCLVQSRPSTDFSPVRYFFSTQKSMQLPSTNKIFKT